MPTQSEICTNAKKPLLTHQCMICCTIVRFNGKVSNVEDARFVPVSIKS